MTPTSSSTREQPDGNHLKVIITQEEIADRIDEIATQIQLDYAGRELTIVAIMKGVVFFLVDLLRKIETPCRLDIVHVNSYAGSVSTGTVRTISDLSLDIRGRDVLIMDDILDTGLTLQFVMDQIRAHRPASVKTCVLLTKKVHRTAAVTADYAGFEVDDLFVIGYGLDYNDLYRNLPHIAAFEAPAQQAKPAVEAKGRKGKSVKVAKASEMRKLE